MAALHKASSVQSVQSLPLTYACWPRASCSTSVSGYESDRARSSVFSLGALSLGTTTFHPQYAADQASASLSLGGFRVRDLALQERPGYFFSMLGQPIGHRFLLG
jgi:hypothetical protein